MHEAFAAINCTAEPIPNASSGRAAPAADVQHDRGQGQALRQQAQELARVAPPERAFDGAPEGQELAPAQALEQGRGKGLRMSCKLLILRQARALHAHRGQAQKVPASRHQEQRKEGN